MFMKFIPKTGNFPLDYAIRNPHSCLHFASFFKFMHANVSATFIVIRALPYNCVYRNPWFSFAVPKILSIVSFLAVNIWLIGKGVAKGAADFFISATVEETILFIILQLLVVLIYFIYPLTVKKYKIIYWSVSEALVIITVLFWGIFIVGPIWLK